MGGEEGKGDTGVDSNIIFVSCSMSNKILFDEKIVLCNYVQSRIQCTLYSVQYIHLIVHCVHYTMFRVHCTLYILTTLSWI